MAYIDDDGWVDCEHGDESICDECGGCPECSNCYCEEDNEEFPEDEEWDLSDPLPPSRVLELPEIDYGSIPF